MQARRVTWVPGTAAVLTGMLVGCAGPRPSAESLQPGDAPAYHVRMQVTGSRLTREIDPYGRAVTSSHVQLIGVADIEQAKTLSTMPKRGVTR